MCQSTLVGLEQRTDGCWCGRGLRASCEGDAGGSRRVRGLPPRSRQGEEQLWEHTSHKAVTAEEQTGI